MASRDELLHSIQPDMKLTKSFFMKIYADEITWPGFAEQALTKLEEIGCNRAREYYQRFVDEYEKDYDAMMKRVAEWYIQQDFKRKEVKESRKQKVSRQNLTKDELTELCQKLLREGVIDSPEQFVTAVMQGR